MPVQQMDYDAEFVCCRSDSVSKCTRSIQIIGPSGLPFKVIKVIESGTGRAGMGTCDFLLVIEIVTVISKNCGWPYVVLFLRSVAILVKNRMFFLSSDFNTPFRVLASEFWNAVPFI